MKKLIGIFLIICIICPSNFLAQGMEPVATKTEEVKGFTMTLVDKDGKKKAVVGGSVANILPGGLVEILDVVARIYNPDSRMTDAIIHSSSGIYNRLRNIVDTDQFVRINRRDMVITGTGFHWEPDRTKIEIHKNVRVEYVTQREPENSKSNTTQSSGTDNPVDAATVITAEGSGRLTYERENVAVFRKNVEINDKNANLKARLMKMFFDDQTQALTKVEAYGNVRIKQPKRESFCRKAIYFADEDKIILTGNPRIVQGLDLYTAKKITIYNKGERVVFEPRAQLVIYASTEHED